MRLVKIPPELRERLSNLLQGMKNVVDERQDSEIDYNAFLGGLWSFDTVADEVSELDKEQNGIDL